MLERELHWIILQPLTIYREMNLDLKGLESVLEKFILIISLNTQILLLTKGTVSSCEKHFLNCNPRCQWVSLHTKETRAMR